MKPNEGSIDRAVRIVVGIILFGLGVFFLTGIIQVIVGIVGLVLFVTGVLGFCALYKVLGISTIDKK